ncbi:hypothetical protein ACIO87_31600 [Streptomyces sp. NPDC087218]|uniref:hypothetical protein n=1 Tax=Streptomyces sp. NPDC087218 TaxID=3365769 RepID=UPI0038060A86
MRISAEPGSRRAAARWPWLALVLVALIHVVACAHGPLVGGSGRTDLLAVTDTLTHATHPAHASHAPDVPGPCGGEHHGPQPCAGLDEPTWAQPGWDKELTPQQEPLRVEAVVFVVAGRAPPVRAAEVPRPGGGRRAALQVWRN